MYKIFIDGQEGTTGLKLFDKIANHNGLTFLKISDNDRKDSKIRAKLINDSDLTFLCLPDVASIEAVKLVDNKDTKIIDASTAHRTTEGWLYGLPEIYTNAKELFSKAKRVAVPGCHASGFISIVKPLVDSKIIETTETVFCTSLTGYSGGGKKMIAEYENIEKPFLYEAPRTYGLTQDHKHLKEMKHICQLEKTPIFQPIVFNFYSGMAVSIPLELKNTTKGQISDIYSSFYKNSELITVSENSFSVKDGFINANALYGKDNMEIVVTGNDERVIVTAVFDNLGKGASGTAVECMNLMLNYDIKTGLKI